MWRTIDKFEPRVGQLTLHWFTGPTLGVFLGRYIRGNKVFDLEGNIQVEGVTHFQSVDRPKDVDPAEWAKAWHQFDNRGKNNA